MTDQPTTHADLGPLGAGSDAARRIADAVRLHLIADPAYNEGRWVAFRLEDGECRPETFASKSEAIERVGMFSSLYGFVKILPMGISYQEAESFLRTSRLIAKNPRVKWLGTDADAPDNRNDLILSPFTRPIGKAR